MAHRKPRLIREEIARSLRGAVVREHHLRSAPTLSSGHSTTLGLRGVPALISFESTCTFCVASAGSMSQKCLMRLFARSSYLSLWTQARSRDEMILAP